MTLQGKRKFARSCYRGISAEAAEKKQSLADYALASQASVETLVIPVRETVVSSPEDFSEEAAAWLDDSVEGVQLVIDQHWVIPFEADIAVAFAAVAAGTATLDAHPSASEETLTALRSAVATSEALAGVDASSGGLRGIGQATAEREAAMDAELAAMVESLPTAFSAHVSAAGEVRASHQAAVAPPPPAEPEYAAPDDEASENDGWCTWSVFMSGFPVWVWGPCSDMP